MGQLYSGAGCTVHFKAQTTLSAMVRLALGVAPLLAADATLAAGAQRAVTTGQRGASTSIRISAVVRPFCKMVRDGRLLELEGEDDRRGLRREGRSGMGRVRLLCNYPYSVGLTGSGGYDDEKRERPTGPIIRRLSEGGPRIMSVAVALDSVTLPARPVLVRRPSGPQPPVLETATIAPPSAGAWCNDGDLADPERHCAISSADEMQPLPPQADVYLGVHAFVEETGSERPIYASFEIGRTPGGLIEGTVQDGTGAGPPRPGFPAAAGPPQGDRTRADLTIVLTPRY